MNKVTTISHRILQVHCQSRTSQRFNQSFVKDLAKPMHNRLTEKTKEEHRTDNSGFAKKRVQWLIEHSTSHQILCYVDSFELRNPLLRKAAERSPDIAFGSSGERTEDYILHSTPRLTATS